MEASLLTFFFHTGRKLAIVLGLLFSQTDLAWAQAPNLETLGQASEPESTIQNTADLAEIEEPDSEKKSISVSISVESLDDLTKAVASLVEQIKENNGNDKSKFEKFLGIVTPVLAAFLGAVLTFLASQYTEKRNWIRSQRNALRDRQLDTIASAVRQIRESLASTRSINKEIAESFSDSNHTPVAKKASLMKFERRQEHWSSHVAAAITSIELTSVELRLLNLPSTLSSDVGDFLDILNTILNEIRRSPEEDFETYCESMRKLVEKLDADEKKFFTAAREFHRGVYE